MDDKVKDLIMSFASKLSEVTNAMLDEFIPLATEIGEPVKIIAQASARASAPVQDHIVKLIIKHKIGKDIDQMSHENILKIAESTNAEMRIESSRAFEEIYKEFKAEEDKSGKKPITAEVTY